MDVQEGSSGVFDMIFSEFGVEFVREIPSLNGTFLAHCEGFIYMKHCAWTCSFLNEFEANTGCRYRARILEIYMSSVGRAENSQCEYWFCCSTKIDACVSQGPKGNEQRKDG